MTAIESNQRCPTCSRPLSTREFAPYCSEACRFEEARAHGVDARNDAPSDARNDANGVEPQPDANDAQSDTAAMEADPEAIRRHVPPRAALVLYHRNGTEVVTLSAGETAKIGRGRPANVDDKSMSREHASFSFADDIVLVEDLGSTNGTFVNGDRLKPNKPCRVQPGDDILLGGCVVELQRLAREEPRPQGLLGHDRLVAELEREIERAREWRRDVTLLFISSTKGAHVDAFASDVQKSLRRVDRAALYSLDVLEVLLPEMKLDDAVTFAQKLHAQRRDLALGVASYPGSAANVDELVDAALEALRAVRSKAGVCAAKATEKKSEKQTGPVVVASALMEKVWKQIDVFAQKSMSVLILGEPGCGKEVVARELHARGPRHKAKMKSLNCGALSPNLIESELFGTVPGAYTGAVDRAGPFEEAAGGTVFLDEIGELPYTMQAKLLRVIEQKVVTRVGSTKEIAVDFRLVSATNRNLREMIAAGTFRQDLFDRLNQADLRLPPLHERKSEIMPLAKHFLARSEDAKSVTGFDAAAENALTSYRWPGNVRELRNAVERAAAIASSDLIGVDDLPEVVRRAAEESTKTFVGERTMQDDGKGIPLYKPNVGAKQAIDEAKATMLLEALASNEWSPEKAAKALDMPRRTFDWNLRKLGIRRQPDGTYKR